MWAGDYEQIIHYDWPYYKTKKSGRDSEFTVHGHHAYLYGDLFMVFRILHANFL